MEHLSLTWLKGRTRTATFTPSILGTGIFIIFPLFVLLFGRKITWRYTAYASHWNTESLANKSSLFLNNQLLMVHSLHTINLPVIILQYLFIDEFYSPYQVSPLNCTQSHCRKQSGFSFPFSTSTHTLYPSSILCAWGLMRICHFKTWMLRDFCDSVASSFIARMFIKFVQTFHSINIRHIQSALNSHETAFFLNISFLTTQTPLRSC